MQKQIKKLYEDHWLDIGVFLIVVLLLGGGLLFIKKSKEEIPLIEISEPEVSAEGVKGATETVDIEKEEKSGLVNINTGDVSELDKLPGIGEKTAEKIINYREENGPFKSKEDLKNVSGIGESKYSEIDPLITVDE